jgi:glycine/D-amino acid oxidase-like deaminating enzyme
MTRRDFIGGAAASAMLAGCGRRRASFPGRIVGASATTGHRLRGGGFPAPSESIETQVVIVGGGIAGLAAARRLARRGVREFLLLELEGETGGNAACGRNAVSAYPWGAHYVPVLNEESTDVVALFEELGIIRGRDASGAPIYEEEYLCADPVERLFDAGRWQEGLLPRLGLTDDDRRQCDAFFARMAEWRERRVFTIPLDRGSRDAEWLALDGVPMAEWMTQQGWHSAPLRWFVDYCCRDDYGARLPHVSAYAGIHYFAARRGRAANADSDAVLTWPEGNGWLARRMAEPIADRIRTGALVWNVDGAAVDYFDVASERSVRVQARSVICAAPRFVAQRIVRGLAPVAGLEYSPWMVANVTLDALPAGRGAPLAWDNVARGSASLGYVVATHQELRAVPRATVLTHYWPLDAASPREERERAQRRTHAEWCELIVTDLGRLHPEIVTHIQHIDVWLWGHGMVRPVPGFVWGKARAQMQQRHGPIVFAHSDLSGLSLFEEAYTRGVQAADALG